MDFNDILDLLELEPILEVERNGQVIRRSTGHEPFQVPIHIEFTIEEEDYQKLLSACNLISQEPYETLVLLCRKAPQLLSQHKKRKKRK